MNEENKICVQFEVKKQEDKPKGSQGVSSLFKRPAPPQVKPDIKATTPKPVKKCKMLPIDAKTDEKNKKESPFLKLLRERQNNINPPPPVPIEECFNENIPADDVGKYILERQGWKEGDEINPKSNNKK